MDKERREVWGAATAETLDRQGEVVDYEASKRAFEGLAERVSTATGGKSLGPVREMHQPKAVGKLISVVPDDQGKRIWVGAKLSSTQDGDDAWQKVQEGILTGFSIGAPAAKRETKFVKGMPETHVTEFELTEVSLVDLPACYDSHFAEVKLTKGMLEPIEADAPRGDDVEKAEKPPTTVQTLIFSKERFKNAEQAKSWARSHDFGAPEVDETEDSYRLRQRDPGDFREGSFRTIEMTDGVKAVIGRLGGGKAAGSECSALEKFMCGMFIENAYKTEGSQMADEKVEKAGKKIGPSAKPQGTPAGAQAPVTPSLQPMATPPAPAKEAATDVHAVDTPVTPPAMQGKEAAPPATVTEPYEEAAAEHEAMGEPPPQPDKEACATAKVCDKCGMRIGATPKAAAADSDELKKMSSSFEGLQKAMLSKVEAMASTVNSLTERIEKIEKAPMPGGPMRTELPAGVAPVEKGGIPHDAETVGMQQLLMKAAAMVDDPFAREALHRQAAAYDMKKILSGK